MCCAQTSQIMLLMIMTLFQDKTITMKTTQERVCTHSIAVHEENTHGLTTGIFQTCEIGVVAIQVVCVLEEERH